MKSLSSIIQYGAFRRARVLGLIAAHASRTLPLAALSTYEADYMVLAGYWSWPLLQCCSPPDYGEGGQAYLALCADRNNTETIRHILNGERGDFQEACHTSRIQGLLHTPRCFMCSTCGLSFVSQVGPY